MDCQEQQKLDIYLNLEMGDFSSCFRLNYVRYVLLVRAYRNNISAQSFINHALNTIAGAYNKLSLMCGHVMCIMKVIARCIEAMRKHRMYNSTLRENPVLVYVYMYYMHVVKHHPHDHHTIVPVLVCICIRKLVKIVNIYRK